MKRKIVGAMCFAALLLSLAAVASADGHRACPNASLAGVWGYTETGTVYVPQPPPAVPTAVLAAAVGKYTFDAKGNFSGTQYSSAGGTVSPDTKRGTYTVNPDCTGSLTLDVYDSTGTTLKRHSVWALVLVNNRTEIRSIMTSMVAPTPTGSVTLLPVMTMTATRLFPPRGDEWRERE